MEKKTYLFWHILLVTLLFLQASVAFSKVEQLSSNSNASPSSPSLLVAAVATKPTKATPEQELATLVKQFKALQGNKAQAGRRDAWLGFSEKFGKVARTSQEKTAAGAIFYQGKSWHELALRSGSRADFTKAVEYYEQLFTKYAKTEFAPEALWNSLVIYDKRLGQGSRAVELAGKLTTEYASSSFANQAKKNISSKGKTSVAKASKVVPVAENKLSVAEQLGLGIQTVMIDAGHGGKDPGAAANSLKEKELTIALAKKIGSLLQKKGFKVVYTRTGDTYIAVQERPVLANEHKVDLFVSVHINANTTKTIRGLEIYYLDTAQSSRAKEVAARENAVARSQVSDLQFILTDLTLNAKMAESKSLANSVRKSILATTKKAKFSLPDNGVRSAPFYVLMGAKMPAILVESAYITNKNDVSMLKSDKFLTAQAEGIVQGILNYKKMIEGVKK